MSDQQSREQKLEASLLQLIQVCATLRFRQKRWENTYGSETKNLKKMAESQIDKLLKNMGVDVETTDFKQVRVKFLKELTID